MQGEIYGDQLENGRNEERLRPPEKMFGLPWRLPLLLGQHSTPDQVRIDHVLLNCFFEKLGHSFSL